MIKFQMLVFDLDGTLIDSAPDLTRCCHETIAKFSLPQVNDEDVKRHVGTGVRNLLELQVKKTSGSAENQARLLSAVIDDFEGRYMTGLADGTKLYEGILELLQATSHLKKVVLTNKLQKFTDPIVDKLHLRSYFNAVYGRGTFSEAKPSALPLQEIAKAFSLSTDRLLMIGDTWVDVLTGLNAGSKTCGVTYGYGIASVDFVKHKPDFVVDTPKAILNILQ